MPSKNTTVANTTNQPDHSGISIANLKEVAAQLGKSTQRVRTLVNEGTETLDGSTFKLEYDLFQIPGTSVQYRIIKADAVAEYERMVQQGAIGARRGSDRVAFIAWLPKDQEAQQAILDLLAANGVEYRVRASKASADDEDASE